jgi:hypothetical protein
MRAASWLDTPMRAWLAVGTWSSLPLPRAIARTLGTILHAGAGSVTQTLLGAIKSAARHTGIPAVLVAALALVLAFRVARRAIHLVVELALALALVLAATKAGWLRF